MWSETEQNPDVSRGLAPGLAYAIVQVKEIKNHRLVQVRNPFNEFEWNGDWAYGSTQWTNEIGELTQAVLDGSD